MNLQDYVKMIRSQWIAVCITILIAVCGALAFSLLTSPKYQATTRLFVSAAAGSTLSDTYQGNRFSQERVVSYTELLMGQTVAQRTIDKLGLDMTAIDLQENVVASAKPDTVLITVSVLDSSPVQARDIANTLSDEFVSMVRELETPEDGSAPDSRVVVEQRASIPDTPVVPTTARNVAASLVVGALLGVGIAVLRGLLDNTIKERETLEAVAGAGTVGRIPMDKERRAHAAIEFSNENSSISEAFRKLRTNLHFLSVDNPPRVIVVTSSMPGEGKSTTAINIALALAEADNTVALLDGDLRRPSVAKYLNLIGSVGFSTVLSGQVTLEDALQKTQYPGLTALASGAIPPNPSELLGSMAAQNILNELREQFDYVVIDSSPLLAVTDAAVLAARADGVLLISRYGKTKKDQLTHAVSALNDVGATVLGAVMTMAPIKGNDAYSYNYRYEATGSNRDAAKVAGDAEVEEPEPDSGSEDSTISGIGSSTKDSAAEIESIEEQRTS